MKNILRILIVTVMICSCHLKQNDNDRNNMAGVEEELMPIAVQSPKIPLKPIDEIEKQEVIKKKIIKDGRLGIQVSELTSTKLRVDTLMKTFDAYYAKENFNNTDWESSYNLKIRIPSANFENFITHIEHGEGKILYKEIDARDVTDQFIDLETRLENKRSYLKRYKDLLNRAKSIKEILEIEEKIRGLEEEIESTTGRLKYLGDLVNFSTLDLAISKRNTYKYTPQKRDNFTEKLKNALSKGWYGFVDFFLFFIKIWPFWIITSLFVYMWKKYKKKKRANK